MPAVLAAQRWTSFGCPETPESRLTGPGGGAGRSGCAETDDSKACSAEDERSEGAQWSAVQHGIPRL